jgi:two-component system response regulator NreC
MRSVSPSREVAVPMIRVVMVDDHAVVRAGIHRLLEAEGDIEIVGESADAVAALATVREQQPDVILLDLVLPGESGIDVLPRLVEEAPAARVLVFTMKNGQDDVREAFAAGAHGYVVKEASRAELVDAVREVARGGSYIHPTLGGRMIRAEVEADLDPLSERERDVLRLLALGHTNQELAATLQISVRTAETHRAHILQKLDVLSRADLVRYAIAHGLFTA